MKLHSIRSGIATGVIGVLLMFSDASAKSYPIKMDRAAKVGDSYGIEATIKSTVDFTVTDNGGGAPKKEHRVTPFQLTAMLKVLEVDEAGGVSKLECTIDQFVIDGDIALDKGTKVLGSISDGKKVFTAAGVPASEEIKQAFGMLLPLHRPEDPMDDAMYGTKEEKEVGATWPIDTDALARSLSSASEGMKPDKKDLKGTVKFAAVKKIDGKEYLQIEATILAENLKAKEPDGREIDQGRIEGTFVKQIAADGSGETAGGSQSAKVDMRIKTQTPDKKTVTIQVHDEETSQVKLNRAAKK